MPTRAELSRLFLIADGFVSGCSGLTKDEVQDRTVALVKAGVSAVQLRDHQAPVERFSREAILLARRLSALRSGLLLTVNTHLHVVDELRHEVSDAQVGAHLGRRGPPIAEARKKMGPDVPLGASVHTEKEAREASEWGADFVFFSPVFQTTSHPQQKPMGLGALHAVSVAVPDMRVYALGGIDASRIESVQRAGAYGVAMLSRLLESRNPEKDVQRITALLST